MTNLIVELRNCLLDWIRARARHYTQLASFFFQKRHQIEIRSFQELIFNNGTPINYTSTI
jgi:hypothetical protein